MILEPAAFPALGERVRATVVIPARDEETRLGRTLDALLRQTHADGSDVDPASYEIVIFANGCRDGTAAVARAVAARSPCHTIVTLECAPGVVANVGAARGAAMTAAATRFVRANRPRAWVATTDADTEVDATWLAATFEERDADAVMGHVRARRAAFEALPRDVRRGYVLEMAFRRAIANVEATLDPVPHDLAPRHGHSYGASLAARADTYLRAGGIPPLGRFEDLAFYAALSRIDARVRHSLRVRVRTSMRADARVEGGFASFVSDVRAGRSGGMRLVEHPMETLQRVRARAALRRYYAVRSADARAAACEAFRCDETRLRVLVALDETFGANVDRVEADALARGAYAEYAPVALADALPVLRRALSAVRPAMRTSVASGAG